MLHASRERFIALYGTTGSQAVTLPGFVESKGKPVPGVQRHCEAYSWGECCPGWREMYALVMDTLLACISQL